MPGPSRGNSDGSRGGGMSAGVGSSFLPAEQEIASRQRSNQVKCRCRLINRPPQGEIESTRRLACCQRKVSVPADLYLSVARGYGDKGSLAGDSDSCGVTPRTGSGLATQW